MSVFINSIILGVNYQTKTLRKATVSDNRVLCPVRRSEFSSVRMSNRMFESGVVHDDRLAWFVCVHQNKFAQVETMFGLIAAGRLVQTDFQQVSDHHVVFDIPQADNVNHVVVFLTGQMPFPDAMGGAVYFNWPSTAGPSWQMLGHITNSKPSAVFKVSGLKKSDLVVNHPFGQAVQPEESHIAQIGISVETLDQIMQLTPALNTQATSVSTFVEFSTKMCENLFNFVSSFAVNQSQMVPNPEETFVPLSTLQQWYTNFLRRLEQNPNFWKS